MHRRAPARGGTEDVARRPRRGTARLYRFGRELGSSRCERARRRSASRRSCMRQQRPRQRATYDPFTPEGGCGDAAHLDRDGRQPDRARRGGGAARGPRLPDDPLLPGDSGTARAAAIVDAAARSLTSCVGRRGSQGPGVLRRCPVGRSKVAATTKNRNRTTIGQFVRAWDLFPWHHQSVAQISAKA